MTFNFPSEKIEIWSGPKDGCDTHILYHGRTIGKTTQKIRQSQGEGRETF